jgi:hypothetical protein
VPGRTGLRRVVGWAGRLLSRVRLLRRSPQRQPVSAMAVDGLSVRPPALSLLLRSHRLHQTESGPAGGEAGAPGATAGEAVAARAPAARPLARRGFLAARTARRPSSGSAAAGLPGTGPVSSGTGGGGTALGPGGLVARLRRGSAGRMPLAAEPGAGPTISASAELPLAPARVMLGGSATSPAQAAQSATYSSPSTPSAARGAPPPAGSAPVADAPAGAAGPPSGGFPGTLAGIAPARSGLPGSIVQRSGLAGSRSAPAHGGLSPLSAPGPGLAAPAPYGPAVSGLDVADLALPGAGLAGLAALGRQAAAGTSAGPAGSAQATASLGRGGLTVSRSAEGLPGAASTRADRPGTAAARPAAGAPGSGLTPAAPGAGTAPLIARPVAGPSVQNPTPAGGLSVLGAGPLPTGVVPDPTGAVRITPERPSAVSGQAPARPAPASGGLGHLANAGLRALRSGHGDHLHAATGPGGLRAGDAGPSVSADWSGAVRPARTHDDGPEFPASASPHQRWRSAISSVPLETPQPLPSAFHDLARSITGRAHPPRYTTGPATRRALSAAGALGATTGTVVHLGAPPTAGPQVAAVLAHELSHARTPVSRPRFLLGGLTGGDDDERQALATGRRYLGGLTEGLPGGPSGAAESVGAGIVGNLPVGRDMAPVAEMATQVARAAVLEATAATSGIASSLSSAGSQLAGGASGLVDSATSAVSGATAPVGDGAPGGGDAPGGAPGGAPGASVVSGPGGTKAAATPLDPDRVIEVVQERLLREIERRGGRWVGVF